MNAAAAREPFDAVFTPTLVLDVLGDHVGAANGITARDLTRQIAGVASASGERRLRKTIETLREAGHRIGGLPRAGYFLAGSDAELVETCDFLYARAMTSLRQIAVLQRVALPDLWGQLRLRLEQTP